MIINTQLRSRFGKILAMIIWALIAFAIGSTILQSDIREHLALLSLLLSFATLIYGIYWHPRIEFTEGYVRVVNLVRDWRISYPTITLIGTQYTLTIHTTDQRKISVWSAPAPSRYSVLGVAKPETEHLPKSTYLSDKTIRPGDIITSDSGSAAAILRRNWELSNASESTGDSGAISMRYNWTWLSICLALLLLGLVLLFV